MKTVWLFFDAIFPITGASLPIVVSILLTYFRLENHGMGGFNAALVGVDFG
jgi:hypothetical protein